jgi:hypothetical protein
MCGGSILLEKYRALIKMTSYVINNSIIVQHFLVSFGVERPNDNDEFRFVSPSDCAPHAMMDELCFGIGWKVRSA